MSCHMSNLHSSQVLQMFNPIFLFLICNDIISLVHKDKVTTRQGSQFSTPKG